MAIPTFNGNACFGAAVKADGPHREFSTRKVAYSGVDGVQSVRQGFRGRRWSVTGILFDGQGSLAAGIAVLDSFVDGRQYTFTDGHGLAWNNVELVEFRPHGRVGLDATWGNWQRYSAVLFQHSLV